jgi:hypothetical protein
MPKILAVDDEPNILEFVKLYLEREGYEVVARSSFLFKRFQHGSDLHSGTGLGLGRLPARLSWLTAAGKMLKAFREKVRSSMYRCQ